MSVTFANPSALLEVVRLDQLDGVQESPPVWWVGFAGQMNDENGTAITGQFEPAGGEIIGHTDIIPQDTYISGTGGRSGRSMTVTGTGASSNWWVPYYQKYGLFWPDTNIGATFSAVDLVPGDGKGLTAQYVQIRRGINNGAPLANINCYLELAYGDTTGNIRIAMEGQRPIRGDYFDPRTQTWQLGVAQSSGIQKTESYLSQGDDTIYLRILPNDADGFLVVEIGNEGKLRFAPPRSRTAEDPNEVPRLPRTENYRFYGTNGWAELWITPISSNPVTIDRAPRKRGEIIPNLGDAQVAINSAGRDPSGLLVAGTLTQDADGYLNSSVTVTPPDAKTPVAVSDVTWYIPPVWSPGILGGFAPPEVVPPIMHVEELEVWDFMTRTFSASSRFVVNNKYGRYTGSLGNFGYNLIGSNGVVSAQRQRGIIAGGFKTVRQDPTRLMYAQGFDTSYKLDIPLGQEVCFDGWARYSAVHATLELAQIPEKYRQFIPFYRYGRAGYDCPFPILGRGTGNSPRYYYPPSATPRQILLELVQDASIQDPGTDATIPYFTGQDPLGNWHFEPYDIRALPLSKVYSSNDPTGYGQILGRLEVYDKIDDLRTRLALTGQDPLTGDLLYLDMPLPWNIPIVGFQYPWVERRGEFVSQAYMERLAESMAILASLPSQSVYLQALFDPTVHAGDLVYIIDQFGLGRGGFFIITTLHSRYGILDHEGRHGENECYSWITAQSAEQFFPF